MQRIAGILRFAFLAASLLASAGRTRGQGCPVEIPIDRKVFKNEIIPASSDLRGKVRSCSEYELYSKSMEIPAEIGDRSFKVCKFREFDREGRLVLEYLRYPGKGRSPHNMKRYIYIDNPDGFTVLEYASRDSSRLQMIRKYTFDRMGRISWEFRQALDWTFWEDTHYSYTEKGLPLRRGDSSYGKQWRGEFLPERNSVIEKWYFDGEFQDSTIFEYDTLGCLVRREAQPTPSDGFPGSAYRMTYTGDTLFERFSMPASRLVNLDVMDRRGRMLQRKEYSMRGKLRGRVEYEYDEAGNLTKKRNHILHTGQKIKYEYDRHGNWILKRIKEKIISNRVTVYYREIEYFE